MVFEENGDNLPMEWLTSVPKKCPCFFDLSSLSGSRKCGMLEHEVWDPPDDFHQNGAPRQIRQPDVS